MDLSGVKNRGIWDFPGGLCFRCRGHRFDPWLGKFHIPYNMAKKKHKNCLLFSTLLAKQEQKEIPPELLECSSQVVYSRFFAVIYLL